MSTRTVDAIQLKRGTASSIAASSYVPLAGEVIVDPDNAEFYAGDGVTPLNALPSNNSKVLTKLDEMDAKLDTLLLFAPTFATATWAQIEAISKSGKAASAFKVGEEKTITLTTGEQVTLVILGFNHDNLTAGGKAGITLGMKDLLATKYPMNSSNTNAGGWTSCAMRTSTMQTLYGQLPDDVKAVIKPVNKLTSAGSQSTTIETTSDNLFLLAEIEVFGTRSYSVAGEGTQYAYYRDIANTAAKRVKKLSNGTGSAYGWWLRSPSAGGSTTFCVVYGGGSAGSYGAGYGTGVAFGFCV